MEAVAALGLAGSIVQPLEFGNKLRKTILEIWNSAAGTTASNSATKAMVQTFLESLESVSADLSQYPSLLYQQNNEDTQLQSVILRCRELADELVRRIDKLRITGPSGKRKAFAATVKSLWQEDELAEIQKRLNMYRRELETRVLLSLRQVRYLPVAYPFPPSIEAKIDGS